VHSCLLSHHEYEIRVEIRVTELSWQLSADRRKTDIILYSDMSMFNLYDNCMVELTGKMLRANIYIEPIYRHTQK